MQTVSDNLGSWAEDIAELLSQLLNASSIKKSEWMGEDSWDELDDRSRQIQSKTLEEYRRFSSVLEVLFKQQPENTIQTFQETKQIKEYRRRGRLTDGVPLLKDKSQIVAIAVEPTFSESLSWLDANNNDDRLLASCLEIMRKMLESQVILLTRDINLQNKAEFARIPFLEPPQALQNP